MEVCLFVRGVRGGRKGPSLLADFIHDFPVELKTLGVSLDIQRLKSIKLCELCQDGLANILAGMFDGFAEKEEGVALGRGAAAEIFPVFPSLADAGGIKPGGTKQILGAFFRVWGKGRTSAGEGIQLRVKIINFGKQRGTLRAERCVDKLIQKTQTGNGGIFYHGGTLVSFTREQIHIVGENMTVDAEAQGQLGRQGRQADAIAQLRGYGSRQSGVYAGHQFPAAVIAVFLLREADEQLFFGGSKKTMVQAEEQFFEPRLVIQTEFTPESHHVRRGKSVLFDRIGLYTGRMAGVCALGAGVEENRAVQREQPCRLLPQQLAPFSSPNDQSTGDGNQAPGNIRGHGDMGKIYLISTGKSTFCCVKALRHTADTGNGLAEFPGLRRCYFRRSGGQLITGIVSRGTKAEITKSLKFHRNNVIPFSPALGGSRSFCIQKTELTQHPV